MIDIFVIIFGLIIGSFLTVCVYRIPYGREKGPGDFGQPLVAEEDDDADKEILKQKENDEEPLIIDAEKINICTPKRSFCPKCRHQLKWYHNIPFFSWLFLGGKCAFCHEPISCKYPLIELISACLCYFTYTVYPNLAQDWPSFLLLYAFCCALLVVSFIDIEYYIIPNVVSIPSIKIAIVIVIINHIVFYTTGHPIFVRPIVTTVQEGFLGFLAGGGLLYAVAKFYIVVRHKEGLGFGDVKLLTMVGILLGYEASFYTIMFGSLIGAFCGILQLVLIRGRKFSTPLPFGPYLVTATFLYLFAREVPIQILRYIGIPIGL